MVPRIYICEFELCKCLLFFLSIKSRMVEDCERLHHASITDIIFMFLMAATETNQEKTETVLHYFFFINIILTLIHGTKIFHNVEHSQKYPFTFLKYVPSN